MYFSYCAVCPFGTYSSPASRDCSSCPNNSVSTMAGLRQCTCIEGYYRALTGEEDLPCSRKYTGRYYNIVVLSCLTSLVQYYDKFQNGDWSTLTVNDYCSVPPAMLSECLARNIAETEVTIQWRNPPHCGGRDDCYYLIKVNDGPPIRYTSITINLSSYTLDSLQPDTRYRVTVSIHNGVSEQDVDGAKSRECSVVVNTMGCSKFTSIINGPCIAQSFE